MQGQRGASKPILLLAVHVWGKGELQRVRGKEAAANRKTINHFGK
jgi:hypothetical protein